MCFCDAQNDVCLLEKLCLAYFKSIEITDSYKTIYTVLSEMNNRDSIKKLLPLFPSDEKYIKFSRDESIGQF